MKKLLFLLSVIVFTSCGCLHSQVPPQYLQVDATCGAALPDFRPLLTFRANCGIDTVEQTPTPGSWLTEIHTTTLVRAFDRFGKYIDVLIPVELIDSVGPELVGVDSTLLVSAWTTIDNMYNQAERMLAFQTWFEEGETDVFYSGEDLCNSTLLTWTDGCKAFTGEGFRFHTYISPLDTVIIQKKVIN